MKLTGFGSDAERIDNGTSTGNYPSQGDPHPIGKLPHPFFRMTECSESLLNSVAWFIESPQSADPLMEGAPKAGRSFYTSLGHLDSSKLSTLAAFRDPADQVAWQDDRFLDHLMGGLQWALDGESTRAFGVGLVGNATTPSEPSSASSSSASSSTASSSSAVSGSGSASASTSAASGSTSPNAAHALQSPSSKGMLAGYAITVVGVLAGIFTVL